MINPEEELKHKMTEEWHGVIQKYTKLSKYKKALDIGTASGLSCWSIATNGDGQIISLDVKPQRDARKLANDRGYKDRVTFLTKSSREFFAENKEMFDLIIVDGSHKIHDVYVDAYEGWRVLNVGGYIVFDDYNHWRLKSDVMPSVRQLANKVNHKIWEEKDKAIIWKHE